VLIYFSAPLVSIVIDSLERSLRPGGMLVLGAAGALHRLDRPPALPSGRPAGQAGPAQPELRRPLSREPRLAHEQRLAAALDAADHGDRDGALGQLAAIKAFASQTVVRAYLVPDLIKSTARYWSRHGDGLYAEAFEVIREATATTGQLAEPERSLAIGGAGGATVMSGN
jgi:hypothetical protein